MVGRSPDPPSQDVDTEVPPLSRVAIIGLGLMGSSVGLALRESMPDTQLCGYDLSPEVARASRDCGAVTCVAADIDGAVRDADIVIIAVPVTSVTAVAELIAKSKRGFRAVTDLASCKGRIVADCERLLGGLFVGGHPMAGSEARGPRSASAAILQGAAWLVTPTKNTDPSALRLIEWLIGTITRCKAIRVSPEDHDRLVAHLSHVPHALAFALVGQARERLDASWERIVAGSFRSATRVAHSSPEFWSAILCDNAAHVSDALTALAHRLEDLRSAVERRDAADVCRLLSEGALEAPPLD